MTREDKQLLLQDLCARLPYGVKAQYYGSEEEMLTVDTIEAIYAQPSIEIIIGQYGLEIEDVKPYLRPMSSMTEEEKKELLNHVWGGKGAEFSHVTEDGSIDGNQEAEQYLLKMELHWINFSPETASCYLEWLYEKQFDVNGLIPLDLAIEVTKDNNPYKIDKEIEL